MGAKMLWALSGIVIAATLQWLGVAAQTDPYVTVAGTTVTLICPLVEGKKREWFKKLKSGTDSDLQSEESNYVIKEFTDSNNGEYYCKDGAATYSFYIRAKVCQGCIELNTGLVIGIICGDLFFTLLVAGLVYWFAKQRGAIAKDFRPLEPAYPPSRPPPTAPANQSEYAPIKSGQRDVYDKLQRR
ncbi:T-cell surface glycoprotein CD3 epsilon chain isoform X2 [Amblyraja radiata]|uniref:T-cell surface glycoprotein CD3 epsilon chain isoform X2 n=1 Tax=Amblyraja radiata TaxID=386614 RepID=UPI0014032DF4|nr:T-cell surface glycoprotein CD3 epsilon chain isoform X2 [Amblyraja radiata]